MEALTTMLLVAIATAYIMVTLKMFLFKFKHSQIQYNSTYCKNKQVDSYTTTNKHVSEEHLEYFLYEALSKAHGIISD